MAKHIKEKSMVNLVNNKWFQNARHEQTQVLSQQDRRLVKEGLRKLKTWPQGHLLIVEATCIRLSHEWFLSTCHVKR